MITSGFRWITVEVTPKRDKYSGDRGEEGGTNCACGNGQFDFPVLSDLQIWRGYRDKHNHKTHDDDQRGCVGKLRLVSIGSGVYLWPLKIRGMKANTGILNQGRVST